MIYNFPLVLIYYSAHHMGLGARKHILVVCEHQRRIPTCASTQSDQRLCYSLPVNLDTPTCSLQYISGISNLCSCEGCFEFYLVANSEDKFSCLEVIKLEYILRLKIKHNDWLLADTCPQAANHCVLF